MSHEHDDLAFSTSQIFVMLVLGSILYALAWVGEKIIWFFGLFGIDILTHVQSFWSLAPLPLQLRLDRPERLGDVPERTGRLPDGPAVVT